MFGMVCMYLSTSASVSTHTSQYTHLARFATVDWSSAFIVCASVSHGVLSLIRQYNGCSVQSDLDASFSTSCMLDS